MANPEHLEILMHGVEEWNKWRKSNREIIPDLRWAHLEGANLEGANLEGANIERAHLEEAYLYGADLEGAHLYGAYLEGAEFIEANLIGANLKEANLRGAHLYGANLKGANLIEANLEGANLRGANLYGANLEGANLYGADLEGANLYGADLEGANLYGAHLKVADLSRDEGTINFSTSETWLVNDVLDFMSDINALYRILLLIRYFNQKERISISESMVDYLLQRDTLFIEPGQQLTVHRLLMSSPGTFSFSGLAEIIQQLREFIKDLWYRNRQEKELGELAKLEKILEICSKHKLTPLQISIMAPKFAKNIGGISRLIESEKLSLTDQLLMAEQMRIANE